MEQITTYLLSLLSLMEKELALFKILSVKTFKGVGWFTGGVFLLSTGLLVLAWTCFTAVAALVGPVAAGLAASILILGGGVTFLWISKTRLK